MKLIIILMAWAISLFAAPTGELSLFVMKDGKPLSKQEVLLFKKNNNESFKKHLEFETDKDGYSYTVLPVGTYQLQLLAKDKNIPQAFARKNFIIKEGKESQLILSLNQDNTFAFMDAEVPVSAVAENKITQKERKENGVVLLSLLSTDNQAPIQNARIFVKGLHVDIQSSDKGFAQLTLPEGEQTISIIHSDFSSQTIKVSVIAKDSINKYIEMTPASMELEEFIVLAPQIEGSVAAMIAEEKNSDSIANVIGSQQMSKQGDSTAASALKRVAGITIMGGKYIYVRGLGDRYSSTELNAMPLPSPNPIKRTVPLDMFPSGVIGSLQVQKTFSSDITGAFGGGYVNVRTKQESEEDYAKIKLGMNAHSTTGKNATSYQGSSSDWSGYDSSYRPFSSNFIQSLTPVIGERQPSLNYTNQEMQAITTTRELNQKSTSIPMGGEVALEASRSFTVADAHEVSVLASYGYKSEAESRQYTSYDYLISSSGVQNPTPDNTATNDIYKESIKHGGLVNVSYKYQNFDAKYTKLYVLNTTNQTRFIEGTFGENNSIEQQNYLEWQERELNIDQLNGGLDYSLFVQNRFDFGLEFATANEYVPNDVYYNYKKLRVQDPYAFIARQSELTFTNRTTNDNLFSAYLKNRSLIPMLSDEDYVELGAMVEQKERQGRINRLRVQSTITDTAITTGPIDGVLSYADASALTYDLLSRPKDQYDASLERNAVYFKSMIKPSQNMDITFGVRQVNLSESIDQWAIVNNIVTTQNNTLDFQKTLPSLSLKYVLDDANQFKVAYSQTFIYPDFREFVNAEFTHPEFLATVAGNPNLVETDIKSLDFQYGFYFDAIDNITASLFYKNMQNPIEDVQTFTTSTLERYSFENSASADLAGFELSWYKNLGFLYDDLDNFIFSGNYTYIYSKVELTDAQKEKFVTQERALQGLSPEVINLSLTYQENDRSVNISYNKMSERLMRVALKNGDVVYALDDYEIPPHLLDFTWIEKFKSETINSDIELTFKIHNILDGETTWKQGDNTTLQYKTGRSYSLSLSAKI
ncbi:TonB-dependent receptor plug domain-containing protein [bacterium]|nr:TonB-dependent receptor plug domain-containing protein [bacterium]MBU1995009.1 TonB-dependent receptor plug domain-containing protein [bacterium]